jgi:hypothetical protein
LTVSSQVKQAMASLEYSQSKLNIYSSQTQMEETMGIYKYIIQVSNKMIYDLEQSIKTLDLLESKYKGKNV